MRPRPRAKTCRRNARIGAADQSSTRQGKSFACSARRIAHPARNAGNESQGAGLTSPAPPARRCRRRQSRRLGLVECCATLEWRGVLRPSLTAFPRRDTRHPMSDRQRAWFRRWSKGDQAASVRREERKRTTGPNLGGRYIHVADVDGGKSRRGRRKKSQVPSLTRAADG
jgi:hypothetical protein